MKTALVYDRVNKWGGAERVLLALHQIWPEAPLYTAVYDPSRAAWAKAFRVIPSFLNRLPLVKKFHEAFPYLMPLAFESFKFNDYDVVISVTSEAAKGIMTQPKTLHVCYCLTPTRYLWSGYKDYFQNQALRLLSGWVVSYLRSWDQVAAQRPDLYLAISKNVQKRIKKYYGREAKVTHPPVDINRFKVGKGKKGNYFLLVSRLVPYKKTEIVVQAFNQLGLPLKVVGVGSQGGKLRKMAEKNIEFLGQLTDKELLSYYQGCQAVIFPQEEDFGLVPLEAQACGRPVIAYREGGALETVIEGETGLFFSPQTVEALKKAVRKFKSGSFKSGVCRQNAERFSQSGFQEEIKSLIEKEWTKRQ